MQQDINLTPHLREHMKRFPRTIGRYYASELYDICRGAVDPHDWLNPKSLPPVVLNAMWNGRVVHEYIQKLLPTEGNEIKIEHTHQLPDGNSFVIVGKVDHIPQTNTEEIWEFKTSTKEMPRPKPAHKHQAKLYCTMANRSRGVVFQPVQHSSGLYLKFIESVDRDDAWFNEQMNLVAVFHKKIYEYT